MNIRVVRLDLTKHVFQVHGVNTQVKVVLRKQVARASLAAFFANLPHCLVGMEKPCGSAHFWALKLVALGREGKLMATQLVKPYIKAARPMQRRNDL
ncbi:hypothetical protein QU481_23005 [Crenobacter sp. SG2303]|uniref:Transposase n=1 Tax=Crenobacter oryzisoli TaxID=3056844 RepID=A0ABT7XV63_9NEIS|nr:hypothetical protein [Crenobacter sp. SG2303]MDN0077687.1 hypothetical protein [Crenobacter sp. SG2303]